MDEELPDHSEHIRKATHHLHQQGKDLFLLYSYPGTDDCEIIVNFSEHSETAPTALLPSHKSPSGASVKPGSQDVQEKEPSVLVQTPVGHTPGVWHSSMSERQKKRIRLAIGYRTK